ncbi:MAG TPA: SDR family NAD(P)-dependent oxidoreductase, partial [Mycobacterium sp.]|nr:SDR family NAD(P)-dependent oxidoreductase [Mycobacterium sp.]
MRTALITGASRGIGAAIADALAPTHALLLAGRPSPALQATADRLGATALPLDVTDTDAIPTATAAIGELDVLV